MDPDEKIRQLISKITGDAGIGSMTVKDGHMWGFSLKKLRELVAQMEAENKEYVLLHVKDPSKVN